MDRACAAIAMGPTFDVLVVNVTVVVGQTALLPCSIQHLGGHKVRRLVFFLFLAHLQVELSE